MRRRRVKARHVVELCLLVSGVVLVTSPFFLLGSRASRRRVAEARSGAGEHDGAPQGGRSLRRADAAGEPAYRRLCDVLDAWDPLSPDVPASYVREVARLDAASARGRATAAAYRDAELPFVLMNVSALGRATAAWTRAFLRRRLATTAFKVEESVSGRTFVYYDKSEAAPAGWSAPQVAVPMDPGDLEAWLDAPNRSRLYYATVSASEGARQQWIRDALPFLAPLDRAAAAPHPDDDWWRDAEAGRTRDGAAHFFMRPGATKRWKGINCRLGMRGVVQAAHYDGKRNWIAMIQGEKRYVLLPPRACVHLELLKRGHPSERHASFDWADAAEREKRRRGAFCDQPAAEVVVREGEILYLPSYWFHYIVSVSRSVQCNARTGLSAGKEGLADIQACGFATSPGS